MELTEIVSAVSNTGMTVVIVAYFIYRDLVFQNKLEETLAALQKTVDMVFNNRKDDENGNN